MEMTELTWADRMYLRGSLATRREDIRRVLRLRFGQVSERLNVVIDEINTDEELSSFFDRTIVARTEDDLLSSAP